MRPIAFFTALVHLTLAATSQRPLLTSQDEYGPNIASATENANLIFNAIHSSMRQWGSSAQHNGMSFFPAYIPEGTLLYHGSTRAERPEHLEWLAFEIPHAEMFARGRIIRRPRNDSRDENEVEAEAESDVDPRNMSPEQLWSWMMPPGYDILPGYLQIYQANRPLKVLYLDGSKHEVLHSQSLLLFIDALFEFPTKFHLLSEASAQSKENRTDFLQCRLGNRTEELWTRKICCF